MIEQNSDQKFRIVSVLMENQPGALSRFVGLFSARNFNIESLSVAPTEDRSLSRLTLQTNISSFKVEQLINQLNKLIDVVKVMEVTDAPHVERELMLIKLDVSEVAQKTEVRQLSNMFRGSVVDVNKDMYTIQIVGSAQKLDAFISSINSNIIVEIVRTGVVGVLRGSKALTI